MLNPNIINFEDSRGELTVINEIPFEVRRIYWISGFKGKSRGYHGHKKTNQVIYHVQGEFSYYGCNAEGRVSVTHLGKDKSLWVECPCLEFHWLEFRTNGLALVLADRSYDEDDYFFEEDNRD